MKTGKIDSYFEKEKKWSAGIKHLRQLVLQTELIETIKWGIPTYTISGKNVLGISAFKNHFGIWFFQGVFLKDPHKVLLNAQEGKTKAMRQLRYEKNEGIDDKLVLAYVEEAIQNSKDGKEIKPEKKPLVVPPELLEKIKVNKKLSTAFDNLSLTKKREYVEYIATAKRAETKISRLEKIISMILEGKGLNDKYK